MCKLRAKNRELKRANEILESASAQVADAIVDDRWGERPCGVTEVERPNGWVALSAFTIAPSRECMSDWPRPPTRCRR